MSTCEGCSSSRPDQLGSSLNDKSSSVIATPIVQVGAGAPHVANVDMSTGKPIVTISAQTMVTGWPPQPVNYDKTKLNATIDLSTVTAYSIPNGAQVYQFETWLRDSNGDYCVQLYISVAATTESSAARSSGLHLA